MRISRSIHCALGVLWLMAAMVQAADPPALPEQFLNFIKAQAAELRSGEEMPRTLRQWEKQRQQLREDMQRAWGEFPSAPCPLEARKLGELQRDGYRVEKIIFQTRPGVWMTANAYVPDRPGKLPAVLGVHGHWRGAKQDPVVQARCIGLAKHGFFVLMVDAFGAGERGTGKALGEYHGEMTAATLFPTGLALSGLQVYENMRAVDYLQSRPEVDAARIGITGASGGGNQTMYAGAWDDRFAAAVPVCSVGNYQAYLGAACCLCEVVPGALRFTEEWRVLALTAPRGLMVINATQDAFQFSVGEARKSLVQADKVYQLFGQSLNWKHTIFESKHDYSGPMREAMYGWMTRHLKETGDGSPVPEPEIKSEDPEALRCFPGESRPDSFVTIPRFAAAEARRVLARIAQPTTRSEWNRQARAMKESLVDEVFGGFPKRTPVRVQSAGEWFSFAPEPGVTMFARQQRATGTSRGVAVLLDFSGADRAATNQYANALRAANWDVVTADLRATGRTAYPRDAVRRAPDHNTAEWSLWIGRPLLGQWVWDTQRLLDALKEKDGTREVAVLGVGPAGVVALCAAALDPRVTRVATLGTLASYVTEVPYENQRLGIIAPGILKHAGDIPHLAALIAPRKLIVGGAVAGGGEALEPDALHRNFVFTADVYHLEKRPENFVMLRGATAEAVVRELQ
ncbi:MAG: acetylxylan esterase [Verrucomicrobiota bacterium]